MVHDYIHLVHPPHPQRRLQERMREREVEHIRHILPGKGWVFAFLTMFLALLCSAAILMAQSQWNGKSQRTFLIISGDPHETTKHLTIVMVRNELPSRKVVLLQLPDTLALETLYGYGPYKSSSLYGLAALEKLSHSFLVQTLAFQFGIDIHDLIVTPNQSLTFSLADLQRLQADTLLFRAKSSMAYIDRYQMWRVLSSLRKDQFDVIDLLSSGMAKKGDNVSGEQRYLLDIVKLDPFILQLFAQSDLRKESKTVAIVNTTSEKRLASRVARAFANMGINVVNITQSAFPIETTNLEGEGQESVQSDAADVIKRILLIPGNRTTISPQHALEYRADLVLFLGNDTAQLFTKRLR
ncbi:MAG: LytR C-terminal domain-containing protein [Candidatus Pacebacteria bacterium]|nr:LytR C-terminal domain-containing protein [Candidatus Paceibacterota bacterium]